MSTLPSVKNKDKSTLNRVKDVSLSTLGNAGNAITGATLLAGAGKMIRPDGLNIKGRSFDFDKLASAKNLTKAGLAGVAIGGGVGLYRNLKNKQKLKEQSAIQNQAPNNKYSFLKSIKK